MGDTARRFTTGVVIAIAVAAFFAGCASGCTFGVLTSSSPTHGATTTTAAAAAKPPTNPACAQAFPTLVDQINAAFTGGENVDNAQQTVAPSGAIYVGGNILRGNELVSSGDVWLSKQGQLYALSSTARELTALPDGRDLGSAGDEYGSVLIDCVT